VIFALGHNDTLGGIPLDKLCARRSDLYPGNTKGLQQTDIHAPRGIRNRNPSKWTFV